MKSRKALWLLPAALLFLLISSVAPLVAQATPRIVRLSLAEGDVQIDRNTGEGWEQALVNMPVTEGARIYAADDAHAELEFEDGGSVRLAGPAQIEVAQLSAGDAQALTAIQVDSGVAYFDVRLRQGEQYRVQGPGGEAFSVTQPSRLRFNVDSQVAALAVTSGQAVIDGDGGGAIPPVTAGQSYNYILGQPGSSARLSQVPEQPDDGWNQQREAQQAAPAEGSDLPTAQLDAYGSYSDVPGYGTMWQPSNVSADWSPYDDGAWSYYPDWGWTFISAYPWGWTPYYYGNWCYLGGRGWWWRPGHGRPIGPSHGWGNGWHPRPAWSGTPLRAFRAPAPPAVRAPHATVAVAGSGLHVGPIAQTHAPGAPLATSRVASSGVPTGGPAGRVGVSSNLVRGQAVASPAPVITGRPGSYSVVGSSHRNGYELHPAPPQEPSSGPRSEPRPAAAPGRYAAPAPRPAPGAAPHAPTSTSHPSAAPAAHASGGGGGGGFHASGGGGGGGHASSGGGGHH